MKNERSTAETERRPTTVDEYLAHLAPNVRATLEGLRRQILSDVPGAAESIGYGMPAYKYRGKPLIYFAAAKKHCALYGTVEGTIRFPPGEPPSKERVRALLEARVADITATGSGRPATRRR